MTTTLDADTLKREMIEVFELILELDENPEMLAKVPKKSTIVKKGKKWMFIPAEKNGRTLLL
jgi:hypothetical protein